MMYWQGLLITSLLFSGGKGSKEVNNAIITSGSQALGSITTDCSNTFQISLQSDTTVLSLSRARSQGSEPRVQLIDNDTKVKKKKDNSLPFIIPPCKKGTKDVKTAGTSTLSRLHKNCQNNKRQRKDDTTWHAILYRTDEDMYFCQAVFIDVDWLITVAHCLVGYDGKIMKPDVVRVRMKGSSQRLKVAKIEVHKSFKYSTFTRDIALLKTESSAAKSASNFVPICLPSKAVVNAHALTQAWWEGDVFDGSSRGDFFQGRAKKMSLVNCKRKIAKKTISYSIENWNICTENPDYCKGDIWMRMSDASPMYTTKGTDGSILVGLKSWGASSFACAPGSETQIHTDIFKYTSWIVSKIEA